MPNGKWLTFNNCQRLLNSSKWQNFAKSGHTVVSPAFSLQHGFIDDKGPSLPISVICIECIMCIKTTHVSNVYKCHMYRMSFPWWKLPVEDLVPAHLDWFYQIRRKLFWSFTSKDILLGTIPYNWHKKNLLCQRGSNLGDSDENCL